MLDDARQALDLGSDYDDGAGSDDGHLWHRADGTTEWLGAPTEITTGFVADAFTRLEALIDAYLADRWTVTVAQVTWALSPPKAHFAGGCSINDWCKDSVSSALYYDPLWECAHDGPPLRTETRYRRVIPVEMCHRGEHWHRLAMPQARLL